MRYKKHKINIVYLPGSDFTVKNGVIINRKPTSRDIDYVQTMHDDGSKLANCLTVLEAKQQINESILKYGN